MDCFVAIDIGGTSAKYALVDRGGCLSMRGSFPTGEHITAQRLKELLANAVKTALSASEQGYDVRGIGVSTLGWVDGGAGRLLGGVENLPALADIDIPALMRKRFNLPIAIHNDADAMALGEMRFGAARDCRDFICMALGTGIGGAIVLDGKLRVGVHARAGELGYLDWQSDDDYLERRTNAVDMVREATLAKHCELDGKAFFKLIGEGDADCAAILKKHMALLGAKLANLVIALDIERIVIGGGISARGDILLPALRRELDAHLPEVMRAQYTLISAQCGNDAALLGAVSDLL